MSLMNYLKRSREVEIMKYILLNKEQFNIVDAISMPTIHILKNNQVCDLVDEIFTMNKLDINIDSEESEHGHNNNISKMAYNYPRLSALINDMNPDESINKENITKKLVGLCNTDIEQCIEI